MSLKFLLLSLSSPSALLDGYCHTRRHYPLALVHFRRTMDRLTRPINVGDNCPFLELRVMRTPQGPAAKLVEAVRPFQHTVLYDHHDEALPSDTTTNDSLDRLDRVSLPETAITVHNDEDIDQDPEDIETMSEFRTRFAYIIHQMMFVSGETAEPSVETTTLIEEIVRQQVIEMVFFPSIFPLCVYSRSSLLTRHSLLVAPLWLIDVAFVQSQLTTLYS